MKTHIKKTLQNILFAFSMIAAIYSCNRRPNEIKAEPDGIDMTQLISHPEKDIFLSDMFSIVDIVKPKGSLLGRYIYVKSHMNHYFVNNESKTLEVFDSTGNLVFKTVNGKGPGELMEITDFSIDTLNNYVYVLDGMNKMIYTLDLQGNFINKIKLKWKAMNMSYLGEDIFCLFVPFNFYSLNGVSYDYYVVIDKSSNVLDSIKIERSISSSPIVKKNFINLYQWHSLLKPLYSDSVYSIENGHFKFRYSMNAGKYRFPESAMSSISSYRKAQRKYLEYGDIMDTPNYLFLRYSYKSSYKHAIYNKASESFLVVKQMKSDKSPGLFLGPAENGIRLWPQYLINENSILFVADVVDIVRAVKNNKGYLEQFGLDNMEILTKTNLEDNPVFLICNFKE